MYKLIIFNRARNDAEKAFEQYEQQRPGLGYEFLNEVKICYTKLRTHPEAFRRTSGNKRRIITKRFPYLIFYTVRGKDVLITSILHAKRKR